MITRKLVTPGASAAVLLLGGLAQQAAATEEIVIYGGEAVARVEAQQALFRSEMDEYVRSVGERIKATLQEAKPVVAPKLEVASAEDEAARG